jgi:hypothetical protein
VFVGLETVGLFGTGAGAVGPGALVGSKGFGVGGWGVVVFGEGVAPAVFDAPAVGISEAEGLGVAASEAGVSSGIGVACGADFVCCAGGVCRPPFVPAVGAAPVGEVGVAVIVAVGGSVPSGVSIGVGVAGVAAARRKNVILAPSCRLLRDLASWVSGVVGRCSRFREKNSNKLPASGVATAGTRSTNKDDFSCGE